MDHDKYEIISYQDLIDYATDKLDAFHSTIVAHHVASCPVCAKVINRTQHGTGMTQTDWQEIRTGSLALY